MKKIIFLTLLLFVCTIAFSQKRKPLFLHVEYQLRKYNYFTVGIGFQPKKNWGVMTRKHPKYSFSGWTANYSKKFENSDWGLSIQNVIYSAVWSGPFGIGIEANYKSVNHFNHFGIKPLIGFSVPVFSIMYGHNFDFYKIKSERVSQNELILGLHFPIFSKKKR